MKYDFIIVLCPSVRNIEGYFAQFEKGMYLGGQVRMDAAVKLAQENNNTTFILVGGYNEDDSVPNSRYYQKSQKTNDMKNYLLEKKIKKERLKIINSLPCTKHNLIAVFNEFKKDLSNEKLTVGLLTNSYHLARAISFWAKLRQEKEFEEIISNPKLIGAESIIGDMKDDRYSIIIPFISRLESELNGLVEIEEGKYRDNCTEKKRKEFDSIIKKEKDILLSLKERVELGLNN